MRIVEAKGYELEKAQSNTSEDFFNRSEVTFEMDGKKKTFHVLYIRYFDETFGEFIPSLSGKVNPLFNMGEFSIFFRDIVAVTCLIKNPAFRDRKRLYINTKEELARFFEGVSMQKLQELLESLHTKGEVHLKDPLQFLEPSSA
ncbi:hypothetical protein FIU87_12450 [Bacillus sp. THAF10]|uniref:hypothetical protein n=1 Tax=Bacillus sp. THAF10 TaxID=2587848 RepID=UPI00126976C3|nr:hypothetical protein [Bacillus sp. THAF10]QFT89461.1 hypothetical protein FIU87_12450 [Bacillus sp. THAF10]